MPRVHRGEEIVGACVLVLEREADCLLDLVANLRLKRLQRLLVEVAELGQDVLEPREGVLRLPLGYDGRIARVGQVRAHRVLHPPERLHLEERGAFA